MNNKLKSETAKGSHYLLSTAPFLLIACSLSAFYFQILTFAVNIPNADDFDVFLRFLNSLSEADGTLSKMALLLTPHNEHPVVLNRALALIQIFTSGKINFFGLIAIGNSAIIVLLITFFVGLQKHLTNRILLFAPAAIAILLPLYYEATQWATAAISNFWVITFAFLSILIACRKGPWYQVIALVLGLAACLTQGNGVLVFLTLSVLFAVKKQPKPSIAWFCIFIITSGVLHLQSFAKLANSGQSQSLVTLADFTLSFLGSAFSFSSHQAALGSGIILIAVFLGLLFSGYFRKNPFFFGSLLFLLFTAAANALARSDLGIDFSFTTSRYKFISLLFLALEYLALIEIVRSKLRIPLATIALVAVSTTAIIIHPLCHKHFELRKQLLTDSMLLFQQTGRGLEYPGEEQASNILRKTVRNGKYAYPEISYSASPGTSPPENFVKKGKFRFRLEHILENDEHILIRGWAFLKLAEEKTGTIYIVLRSEEKEYFFLPEKRIRPDLSAHHRKADLDRCGFFGVVPKKELSPGTYEIGLALRMNGYSVLRFSHKGITILKNLNYELKKRISTRLGAV